MSNHANLPRQATLASPSCNSTARTLIVPKAGGESIFLLPPRRIHSATPAAIASVQGVSQSAPRVSARLIVRFRLAESPPSMQQKNSKLLVCLVHELHAHCSRQAAIPPRCNDSQLVFRPIDCVQELRIAPVAYDRLMRARSTPISPPGVSFGLSAGISIMQRPTLARS